VRAGCPLDGRNQFVRRIHTDLSAAWIAGSFAIKAALRAFCQAMTS